MDVMEATREIGRLENRYFELHRVVRAMRARLGAMTDPGGYELEALSELRVRLVQTEEEMRAILRDIASIEDSLLD